MSEAPLWLRIHERIDFYLFLAQRLSESGPRTGLDRAIDQATGAAAAREKEISRVLRHLARLKKLYRHLTEQPHTEEPSA